MISIDDLEDAIKAKDLELLKSAIESGFDLNLPIEDNYRLLMLAASCGQIEIVKLLVEAGANIHTRVKDYLNAIEYAELGFYETKNDDFDKGIRYLEIIEFLEKAGAKFDYEE